jgi:hypothetical protein
VDVQGRDGVSTVNECDSSKSATSRWVCVCVSVCVRESE